MELEEPSLEQQDLDQRRAKHQIEKTALRDPEKTRMVWEKAAGEYPYDIFDPDNDEIHFHTEELSETESLIYNYLKAILKHRQDNNDPRPVVAIDFGGGWLGISFLKIISKFDQSLIDQNKIIFVSTTLENQPTQEVVDNYITDQKISQDKIDLINKYRSKVHFVTADSRELASTEIVLNDGQKINLTGNTNFIHEDYCLRHSQVPDDDWRNLLNLLGRDAIVITSSRYAQKHEGEPDQDVKSRQKALDRGKEYIAKSGLTEAFEEETPYYDIYTTPSGQNIVNLISHG